LPASRHAAGDVAPLATYAASAERDRVVAELLNLAQWLRHTPPPADPRVAGRPRVGPRQPCPQCGGKLVSFWRDEVLVGDLGADAVFGFECVSPRNPERGCGWMLTVPRADSSSRAPSVRAIAPLAAAAIAVAVP